MGSVTRILERATANQHILEMDARLLTLHVHLRVNMAIATPHLVNVSVMVDTMVPDVSISNVVAKPHVLLMEFAIT